MAVPTQYPAHLTPSAISNVRGSAYSNYHPTFRTSTEPYSCYQNQSLRWTESFSPMNGQHLDVKPYLVADSQLTSCFAPV